MSPATSDAERDVLAHENAVGMAKDKLQYEQDCLKFARANLAKVKKRKTIDNRSNPAPKKDTQPKK